MLKILLERLDNLIDSEQELRDELKHQQSRIGVDDNSESIKRLIDDIEKCQIWIGDVYQNIADYGYVFNDTTNEWESVILCNNL